MPACASKHDMLELATLQYTNILSEIFETFEDCFPMNMLVHLNLEFF